MNSSIKNDFDILYIKKYQVFSNGDVDYCTITGYVADKYSENKEKKPVINCTKFVTDFFQPRIIDCKRFASGIIDPSSCKPNLQKDGSSCDVEDVPNEYIGYLNERSFTK